MLIRARLMGVIPVVCALSSTVSLAHLICHANVTDVPSIVAQNIYGGACYTDDADITCPNMMFHGNCRDQDDCVEDGGVWICEPNTEGHYDKKDSVKGCGPWDTGIFGGRDKKDKACYYKAPCKTQCVPTTGGRRCDEFNPETSTAGETVDAGECKDKNKNCPPMS